MKRRWKVGKKKEDEFSIRQQDGEGAAADSCFCPVRQWALQLYAGPLQSGNDAGGRGKSFSVLHFLDIKNLYKLIARWCDLRISNGSSASGRAAHVVDYTRATMKKFQASYTVVRMSEHRPRAPKIVSSCCVKPEASCSLAQHLAFGTHNHSRRRQLRDCRLQQGVVDVASQTKRTSYEPQASRSVRVQHRNGAVSSIDG